MVMNMLREAGSGNRSHINPYVEAFRLHHLPEDSSGTADLSNEQIILFFIQLTYIRYVSEWSNEQVPVIIGEPVHHREDT